MGFYQKQPFNSAHAYYLDTELYPPQVIVEVTGNAQNFTSGIQLVRDTNTAGSLVLDLMGWTGPIGEGTRAFKVAQTFQTTDDYVVVVGENKHEKVLIQTIPANQVEAFLKEKAIAQ